MLQSPSLPREVAHEEPPGSQASSAPHRLQCTASLSCSESPHEAHRWCSFLGRNSTCTIRKNKLMPTIIITIDSTRPSVPVSVMSPNPVVVSVATVK